MKNVVLLTIDTLRQDVLGSYGSTLGHTAFLDSLQNSSIKFAKAQSCGPYTQASFPAILTSSYYHEYGRTKKLAVQRTLISEPLQEAGIETAAFHSNAYLCAFFGWNRAWSSFYDSMEADVDDKVPYIKAQELNGRVSRWLENRAAGDKPFFLWTHYMDVHEPYVPEPRFVAEVDSALDLSDDEMFALFQDALLKRDLSDPAKVELLKKLYLAHVREVDEAARELFGILEKAGVLEDSVVIVTSDHGDEFGEHGGLSHDGKMYRELIDVPLLIHDRSLAQGRVCESVISTLDIAPTIVHLFGLDPVDGFAGSSLLPLDGVADREVFGEAYCKSGRHEEKENPKEVHYCRQGDLKVIYDEKRDAWELYDLAADPGEKQNVAESHPDAEALKDRIRPRVRRHQA